MRCVLRVRVSCRPCANISQRTRLPPRRVRALEMFAHFVQHQEWSSLSPEDVVTLYERAAASLQGREPFLAWASQFTADTARDCMAVVLSPDKEARVLMLGIDPRSGPTASGFGGGIKADVAKRFRTGMSSIWTNVLFIPKAWEWSDTLHTVGAGNMWISLEVATTLTSRKRQERRNGITKKKKEDVHIEDFVVSQRQFCAIKATAISKRDAALAEASSHEDQLLAYVNYYNSIGPFLYTMDVTLLQRTCCARGSEPLNLRANEVQMQTWCLKVEASMAKKRQLGVPEHEVPLFMHTGVGFFCHSLAESCMPCIDPSDTAALDSSACAWLKLHPLQQGMCTACTRLEAEQYYNFHFWLQRRETLPSPEPEPREWLTRPRPAGDFLLLPRLSQQSRKAGLSLLSPQGSFTVEFIKSPVKQAASLTTKFIRLLMQAAYPDGKRQTPYGFTELDLDAFSSHSLKRGALKDSSRLFQSSPVTLLLGNHLGVGEYTTYQTIAQVYYALLHIALAVQHTMPAT